MTDQIVTANDLREGDVVFLTENGSWSRRVRDAAVANDKEAAQALLESAQPSVADNTVVEPYLVNVAITADGPFPNRYREQLRCLGPTDRTNLGKQAQSA